MDISIDLETLGKTPNTFIAALGAVAFDIKTGEQFGYFDAVINLSLPQPGRVIDGDTVKWWLKQDTAASEKLVNGDRNLYETLEYFRQWYETDHTDAVVWGNGATFDISILENAYGYCQPWEYYNIGDMRTLLRLAKSKGYQKPAFTGVKHSALDDARYQARVISECWNY